MISTIVVPAVIVLGVAALLASRWHRQRSLLAEMRANWGKPRQRQRDLDLIRAYHDAVLAGAPPSLDDRTWQDLNLDDVFAHVDRTESAVGQQVLYHRLRTAPTSRHLDSFQELVDTFAENTGARERAQIDLRKITGRSAYDIWWLAQPGVLAVESWHAIFPVLGATMVALTVASLFWHSSIVLLGMGALVNVVLRSTVVPELQVVVGPFRQLAPLLLAARRLDKAVGSVGGPLTRALADDVPRLARLWRIAGWASRDRDALAAGNLNAIVIEYLNLFFYLDANALFLGARELKARSAELLRVLAAVGEIDAALSVASWRAGTTDWVSARQLPPGSGVHLQMLRHPLISEAVANSIDLALPAGMLITGSNMSGKTTLLRTVGVNAVLAQTVNTVLAARWEAPRFVIRSCIGRADNLLEGTSYYAAEVEAVLAIVREAAASHSSCLFLFDELFRGTNLVERLAAGEAVLRALVTRCAPAAHLVLAATHDGDLVNMLVDAYVAVHFGDSIGPGGLSFDYVLRPGAATTRNAIALLRLRGAPPWIVDRAEQTARRLDGIPERR